jgi:hypothetical protein
MATASGGRPSSSASARCASLTGSGTAAGVAAPGAAPAPQALSQHAASANESTAGPRQHQRDDVGRRDDVRSISMICPPGIGVLCCSQRMHSSISVVRLPVMPAADRAIGVEYGYRKGV